MKIKFPRVCSSAYCAFFLNACIVTFFFVILMVTEYKNALFIMAWPASLFSLLPAAIGAALGLGLRQAVRGNVGWKGWAGFLGMVSALFIAPNFLIQFLRVD